MTCKASFRRTFCFILLCALFCSGCATTDSIDDYRDPFEKYNRAVYKFNDDLDRAVLKPVAKGYKKNRARPGS